MRRGMVPVPSALPGSWLCVALGGLFSGRGRFQGRWYFTGPVMLLFLR
jgi:hypothetical protein